MPPKAARKRKAAEDVKVADVPSAPASASASASGSAASDKKHKSNTGTSVPVSPNVPDHQKQLVSIPKHPLSSAEFATVLLYFMGAPAFDAKWTSEGTIWWDQWRGPFCIWVQKHRSPLMRELVIAAWKGVCAWLKGTSIHASMLGLEKALFAFFLDTLTRSRYGSYEFQVLFDAAMASHRGDDLDGKFLDESLALVDADARPRAAEFVSRLKIYWNAKIPLTYLSEQARVRLHTPLNDIEEDLLAIKAALG